MAWTAPRTWTDTELVTAAIMNPHVRDNFLAVGPHLIVRKTSNQTVTSSTVLVNDTALVLPVSANEIWQVAFNIVFSGSTAGNIKFAFTFPAAGEVGIKAVGASSGATFQLGRWVGTTTPTAATIFDTQSASEKDYIVLEGVFINAGTGGNLTLQWAQGTSDGTATTVYANSTVWGVKLA